MVRKIFTNKKYRRKVTEFASFVISCIFSTFNLLLWIISGYIWYFIISTYYVALAFARGGIYFLHYKSREKSRIKELKLYRSSGIFLLLMNFSICAVILLTFYLERKFKYSSTFIFGAVSYALSKIFLSIINISKTRGTKKYLEISYRSLNLVDACFSAFSLQVALINRFSADAYKFALANALTGAIVVLVASVLGVYNIIRAKNAFGSANEQ